MLHRGLAIAFLREQGSSQPTLVTSELRSDSPMYEPGDIRTCKIAFPERDKKLAKEVLFGTLKTLIALLDEQRRDNPKGRVVIVAGHDADTVSKDEFLGFAGDIPVQIAPPPNGLFAAFSDRSEETYGTLANFRGRDKSEPPLTEPQYYENVLNQEILKLPDTLSAEERTEALCDIARAHGKVKGMLYKRYLKEQQAEANEVRRFQIIAPPFNDYASNMKLQAEYPIYQYWTADPSIRRALQCAFAEESGYPCNVYIKSVVERRSPPFVDITRAILADFEDLSESPNEALKAHLERYWNF